MASGKGLRAKWLPKLAKSLGWSPGRLRHLLNHNGYEAPFKSELKALQILKAYGLSPGKYKPTEDAVGKEVEPAESVQPMRGLTIAPRKPGNGTKKLGGAPSSPVAEAPATSKKKNGSWSDRLLVSRLAKLLPEGPTPSGKNRARYILKKAGVSHKDEPKALEAFQQAGIDITDFEYATKPGEPGGMLIRPPAREYDELLAQYTEMGERLKLSTAELDERDNGIKKLRDMLDLVRRSLLSYEKVMLGTPGMPGLAMTKFGGLPKPLNYPIDVLAEIRDFQG